MVLALKPLCSLDQNGSMAIKQFKKCQYIQHTGNDILYSYLNLIMKYFICQLKNVRRGKYIFKFF